jgi:hypothetical protein
MRRLLLLIPAAAALACGGIAHAADSIDRDAQNTVSAMFGNTVMSLYDDGQSQKIWMKPDGTWTGKSRRGVDLSGRWTMKGDKVCLRQTQPPTLPISFCQQMPKDPDVTLTSHDLLGKTIHLRIVKGIVAPPPEPKG